MGRSRKSPEDLSAARRASVNMRWHPERAEQEEQEDFLAPAPESKPDSPVAKLPGRCAYDEVVRFKVVTYQDAVQREKAIAAEIENRALLDQEAVRKRALYTADQVEADALAYDEVLLEHLRQIPERFAAAAPLDHREALRTAGKVLLAELRAATSATARGLAAEKARKK